MDAGGLDDVPVCEPGRDGDLFSPAVPHEIPLHQQDAVVLGGRGHACLQLACAAHHVPALVVGGVFCQRGMQDTRDVRVHVQHPALDDAQAGFYGVFPDVAHCHFGQHAGVRPGGDVADVSLPLELHALVRCRVDAFGFVPACGAYAALPRGAQIPFGGHRLVGGGALGFAVAGGGLFL